VYYVYLVLHVEFGSTGAQVLCYMQMAMTRGPVKWSISMLYIWKKENVVLVISTVSKLYAEFYTHTTEN